MIIRFSFSQTINTRTKLPLAQKSRIKARNNTE